MHAAIIFYTILLTLTSYGSIFQPSIEKPLIKYEEPKITDACVPELCAYRSSLDGELKANAESSWWSDLGNDEIENVPDELIQELLLTNWELFNDAKDKFRGQEFHLQMSSADEASLQSGILVLDTATNALLARLYNDCHVFAIYADCYENTDHEDNYLEDNWSVTFIVLSNEHFGRGINYISKEDVLNTPKYGALGELIGEEYIGRWAVVSVDLYSDIEQIITEVYVDNQAALKEYCESGKYPTIKLATDIIISEDLAIRDSSLVLDLNGHSLVFGPEKSLYICSGQIDMPSSLTLTSSKPGAQIFFLCAPEEDPGIINNKGVLLIDGDILITAMSRSPTDGSALDTQRKTGAVIDKSSSGFVVSSENSASHGDSSRALICNWGQLNIRSVSIRVGAGYCASNELLNTAIANYGGDLLVYGGTICIQGDYCVGISSYDTDDAAVIPDLSGNQSLQNGKSSFFMSGGAVIATGKYAVALSTGKSCILLGGVISALGENAVGIEYCINDGPENVNSIYLYGGTVIGEAHALVNHCGLATYHNHSRDEMVTIDTSIRELRLDYTDIIAGSWYSQAFYNLIDSGLLEGYPDGTFRPDGFVSRAEYVSLLFRWDHGTAVRYEIAEPSFSDVGLAKWYSHPIAWGVENGIVIGYSDGSFGPNDYVDREQLITMLYRYAKYRGYEFDIEEEVLSPYSDAEDVSDWAKEPMRWAVHHGLIQGRSDNRLAPHSFSTRAEATVIFSRFSDVFGSIAPTD